MPYPPRSGSRCNGQSSGTLPACHGVDCADVPKLGAGTVSCADTPSAKRQSAAVGSRSVGRRSLNFVCGLTSSSEYSRYTDSSAYLWEIIKVPQLTWRDDVVADNYGGYISRRFALCNRLVNRHRHWWYVCFYCYSDVNHAFLLAARRGIVIERICCFVG